MAVPDFKRAALLAHLASVAYDTDLNAISLAVALDGFNFVEVVEAAGFQAVVMINPDTNEQVIDFRGTPVTCGRSIADTLTALYADVALDMIDLGGGVEVLHAPYRLVLEMLPRLEKLIDFTKPLTLTGHSLGAVCALAFAYQIRKLIADFTVIVFAPFQFANAAFHAATFPGKTAPTIFGRHLDFAPGWNHLDLRTALAGPIWHITATAYVLMTSWPLYAESEPDHSVTAYSADLAALAAQPIAA